MEMVFFDCKLIFLSLTNTFNRILFTMPLFAVHYWSISRAHMPEISKKMSACQKIKHNTFFLDGMFTFTIMLNDYDQFLISITM